MNSWPHLNWESTLATYGFAWPKATQRVGPMHRPAALCYICCDDRVLLLRREQPPFVGRWTAPGGKIRAGETPEQAVKREMYEETGLVIVNPELRMIVVESGPAPLLNWVLFVYRTSTFEGAVHPGDEGPLQWVAIENLDHVGMPDVDRVVSRHVLNAAAPRWIDVSLDTQGRTCRLSIEPLPTV